MKLKTKIEHEFGVDPSIMDDTEFNVDIPQIKLKTFTKIVNVKKRKFKVDGSTRLF